MLYVLEKKVRGINKPAQHIRLQYVYYSYPSLDGCFTLYPPAWRSTLPSYSRCLQTQES